MDKELIDLINSYPETYNSNEIAKVIFSETGILIDPYFIKMNRKIPFKGE